MEENGLSENPTNYNAISMCSDTLAAGKGM